MEKKHSKSKLSEWPEAIGTYIIATIPLSGVAVIFWQIYWWLRDAIWYPVSNKVMLCYLVDWCELRESSLQSKMKGLDVIRAHVFEMKSYLFESSFSITMFVLFFMIYIGIIFDSKK